MFQYKDGTPTPIAVVLVGFLDVLISVASIVIVALVLIGLIIGPLTFIDWLYANGFNVTRTHLFAFLIIAPIVGGIMWTYIIGTLFYGDDKDSR